jgi:acetyltransferase-like isoleucine patch superfamily enzyme
VHILERLAAAPAALRRALREEITNEVERRGLPQIHFGSGVILRGSKRIRAGRKVFLDHRAYLNCNGEHGFIVLGDNVEIGPYSVLWGGGGITIGNDVHVGTHVHITSMEGDQMSPHKTDAFAPLDISRAPVTIGDHVLIYSHAVIVPGVTIGHHAAIAAGAVVIEDVPPYALVGGVPAKVLAYGSTKHRTTEDHVSTGTA